MKCHLFLKEYHFGLVIEIYNKIPVKEHFETGVICVNLLSEQIHVTVKKITSYTVLQVESREGSESVKCICHMNKLNSLGILEAII